MLIQKQQLTIEHENVKKQIIDDYEKKIQRIIDEYENVKRQLISDHNKQIQTIKTELDNSKKSYESISSLHSDIKDKIRLVTANGHHVGKCPGCNTNTSGCRIISNSQTTCCVKKIFINNITGERKSYT